MQYASTYIFSSTKYVKKKICQASSNSSEIFKNPLLYIELVNSN